MISATRRLEFDYGHRVLGHEGHCKNLHGHHGIVEITVVPEAADPLSPGLDKLGRVIDFSVIKQVVGTWINEHWDHNMIVHSDDPLVQVALHPSLLISHTKDIRCKDVLGEKAPFILPNMNPTAENLAKFLHGKVGDLLPQMRCINVRFYETPNCWSDSRDFL